MKEKKALNIVILVFQILLAAVMVASLIFYTVFMIDVYRDSLVPPAEDAVIHIDPLGIGYAFILVFSIISNAAVAILSLIPLIMSLVHRGSSKRKRNIIFSSALLASPFLLEAVILLFGLFTGVLGK